MDVRFTFARLWYALIGAVGTLGGLATIAGPLFGGCRIALSQDDMALPLEPATGTACVQFVDPVVTSLSIVVGLLAVAAATWVISGHAVRRSLARAGIIVGLLASAVPALLLASVLGYYRAAPGLTEIMIGVAPIAIGVAAAVIMWRRQSRTGDSTPADRSGT